jgi:hypothetical protein
MKRKPEQIQPASEQHRRFIETARQLEADEDTERFEKKLGRIVRAKPKPKPKPE